MTDAAASEGKFTLTASRHFPQWLAGTGGGLAFTSHQAGKIFFLGTRPDGRLSVFERTFARSSPSCRRWPQSASGPMRSVL